jgi:hypothetical protein
VKIVGLADLRDEAICWRDALAEGLPLVPTADEIAVIQGGAVALAVPSPAEAEWAANALDPVRMPVVIAPRPYRGAPSSVPTAGRPFRHMLSCLCRTTPDLHDRIATDMHGAERDGMTTDKPWWQASWQLPPVGALDRVQVVLVPHAGEYCGMEPPNLLDAMGAGCCVIAQEFPGIDDLWRDGVDLVVWRKRQSVEPVLRDLLHDAAKIQRIADGGREGACARTEARWREEILAQVRT